MSTFTHKCERCSDDLSSEEGWLADEGILCRFCCKLLYPERFKCYCGICGECAAGSHVHEWKQYQGLREVYEYCIHCDEKRK